MKITLVAVLGLLMFVAPCMANDNEYRTGTLTKALSHVGVIGGHDTNSPRPRPQTDKRSPHRSSLSS
jgi:hypothetical protein